MTAQQQRNLEAQKYAQTAVQTLTVKPTGRVQYHSRGRIAVIGGLEAMEFTPRLQAKHQTTVVLLDGAEEPSTVLLPVGGRKIQIDGYLGHYQLAFGEEGKANYETLEVDIVLDLGATPILNRELLPPGYVHAQTDENSLAAAQLQVDELVGTFEKPRYFDYDASICAHGRAGNTACRRCLDACPAEAITSLGEAIEVNPYLCQGGGVCASVCPSGAIRYNYPAASDTEDRIRSLIQAYLQQGGEDPVLGFVAEDDAASLVDIPANLLLIVVEEVASIGLDIWLAALAYGAQRVLLIDGGSIPESVSHALQTQLQYGGEILSGLAYASDAVELLPATAVKDACYAVMPGIKPATFAGLHEKRRMMFMALDHLFAQSPAPQEKVALTPGAPFGTLEINAKACTLCMSCTSVCPTQAISAGNELPKLIFNESRCVQCSLCAMACPERAITLVPRLLLSPELRKAPVTLHEEAALCCIGCGKPFTTQSAVTTMLARLEGHWMFQTERAKNRLLMCADCRVVDIAQDPEAMEQGFSSRTQQ